MDGLVIVDVLIGLAFTFLGLSVMASSFLEGIVSLFRARAKFLQYAISRMMGSNVHWDGKPKADSVAKEVMSHPLISTLGIRVGKVRETMRIGDGPSYIPSEVFATAFIDTVIKRAGVEPGLAGLAEGISTLTAKGEDNPLAKVLVSYVGKTSSIAELEEKLSDYYDNFMDRVTGWYKRYTQLALFLIGLVLAVSLNVDAFKYADEFSSNGVVRCMFVEEAAAAVNAETDKAVDGHCKPEEKPVKKDGSGDQVAVKSELEGLLQKTYCSNPDTLACKSRVAQALAEPELKRVLEDAQALNESKLASLVPIESLPGYLATALAVSMGSQFWLGILRMLFSIRGTGNVPAKRSKATSSVQAAAEHQPPGAVATMFTRLQIEDLQNQFDMPEHLRTGELDLYTRSLIAKWQSDHDLPSTGELSLETYERIMQPG